MKVGVPKEVKNHEYRVAITPVGVHELVERGHEVFVERTCRCRILDHDAEFEAAGAKLLDTADEVWGNADMVLKVKEPIAEEYHRLREGLVLFTYLHLAADRPLTEELVNKKVTAIAYETVQLPSGGLPLLYPMSEVAGCLAPQVGAYSALKANGGRGVLMGGVGGVANAKVVIIGAGVSGQNAANIALGHGRGRHVARHAIWTSSGCRSGATTTGSTVSLRQSWPSGSRCSKPTWSSVPS